MVYTDVLIRREMVMQCEKAGDLEEVVVYLK
jgi:hypothetical protein